MLSPSKLLGSSHHPGSYGRLSFIGRFLLKPESLLLLPQTSTCPKIALKQNVPPLPCSFLGLLVTADLLLRGSTPLLTHTLNQLCVVTATVTLHMCCRATSKGCSVLLVQGPVSYDVELGLPCFSESPTAELCELFLPGPGCTSSTLAPVFLW